MTRFACLLIALAALASPLAASAAAADARSFKAEVLFRLHNPCPASGEVRGPCKGYVIDRIVPHVCGGEEAPENMQWQTIAEAREKDRWERIGCRPGRKQVFPGGASITESFATGEPVAPVEATPLPAQ
jgi:hypothetical protein